MKFHKITALIYYDMLIFRNSKWKLAEFVYFPVTTIVIWGLFSIFVREQALQAGLMVLMVNIFWNFAYLAQSQVNMQMNDDSWSGSLKQILATGISEFEYLAARILSSVLLSILIMLLMLGISYYGFGLAIISAKAAEIFALSALTLLASLALGILVAAMIIVAGREYSFLAWTALQAFVLLSAPFYPVSIFPAPLQALSWAMPFTGVFEATRGLVSAGAVSSGLLMSALVTIVFYLALSVAAYRHVFRRARKTGGLVRLA